MYMINEPVGVSLKESGKMWHIDPPSKLCLLYLITLIIRVVKCVKTLTL